MLYKILANQKGLSHYLKKILIGAATNSDKWKWSLWFEACRAIQKKETVQGFQKHIFLQKLFQTGKCNPSQPKFQRPWISNNQRSARVLMESRYWHLLPKLDWSRHPLNFPVSTSLGLDIQEISQSRWVLVSTSNTLASLDESWAKHPQNIKVLLIY